MKTIFPHMKTSLLASAGMILTDAERAAGRLMRAPDHGASGGGTGDAGSGSGGGDSGGDSGGGAAGAGGDGGNGGAQDGGNAGDAANGGTPDGKSGGDGAGDGAASGSILSDAARDDEGGAGAAGEGGEGEGDGPRLTFGEGDDAVEILGAPEAYELSVPQELADKGMSFDKEAFDLVEPVFRDLNLSGPAAQSVVNAYAEKILPLFEKRAHEGAEGVGADMRRQWQEAAEAEFSGKDGNPTLKEAKALSKQAFIASGVKPDSPFLTMLEESGLGNHPDMIRFVSWVGRNVGEAKIDTSGSGEAPQRLADKVYGQPTPRGER